MSTFRYRRYVRISHDETQAPPEETALHNRRQYKLRKPGRYRTALTPGLSYGKNESYSVYDALHNKSECTFHSDVSATTVCDCCGIPLCAACAVEYKGRTLCCQDYSNAAKADRNDKRLTLLIRPKAETYTPKPRTASVGRWVWAAALLCVVGLPAIVGIAPGVFPTFSAPPVTRIVTIPDTPIPIFADPDEIADTLTTVYWASGEALLHRNSDCPYLQGDLQSGSEEDAARELENAEHCPHCKHDIQER